MILKNFVLLTVFQAMKEESEIISYPELRISEHTVLTLWEIYLHSKKVKIHLKIK